MESKQPKPMGKADTKRSIEMALGCLRSDHVLQNKFRLGALGSADIEQAIAILDEVIQRGSRVSK